MTTDTFIGFDSAWTDKKKAPGAICAIVMEGDRPVAFHAPSLATFDDALAFIDTVRSPTGATLIALDQPTVVPNLISMRPVERVAASLVSWMGGGVQPSNRGKVGMFCDASPIWSFLTRLNAIERPEEARAATTGLHLIEVFPALALASLEPQFFARLAAPRYNPARRKTFRIGDWQRVADVASGHFKDFGADDAAAWCAAEAKRTAPAKADQDRLDAMLCLFVAMHWRLASRDRSMMAGTLDAGYMVFPASTDVRARFSAAALKYGIPAG
jgi:predicted RNase H-like nuclease